jgi:hypothetical protein
MQDRSKAAAGYAGFFFGVAGGVPLHPVYLAAALLRSCISCFLLIFLKASELVCGFADIFGTIRLRGV